MSVPLPHGYIPNPNEVFIDQSQAQAGPSNYARPPAQGVPAHLQGPPPQTPFYPVNGHMPTGFPPQMEQIQHIPQQQYMPQYTTSGIIPHIQPGFAYPGMEVNGGAAVVPNFHFGSIPQNPPYMDEWTDGGMPHEGQEMVYSNLEVKHRRRTTPDQLKILEYWYDINPKPDNALREHLAAQLGMTKRNVQVWFQNRRAKMKGLAKKDEKGDNEEEEKTPEKSSPSQQQPQPQQRVPRPTLITPMGPPMGPPPMARRASLANGEAAKIEMFVAKRAAAAANGLNRGLRPPGFVSPQRSPLMGQAFAARRQSIPYPTPITAGPNGGPNVNGPGPSPKISPVVRVMPSALHLTAMRNNTRRASMPGAAQLISSGPFTPPRVITNQHQVGLPRELSTIKDDDSHHVGADGTQAQQQLFSPANQSAGYDQSIPFSPNSPLPNPAFSFGTEGHQQLQGQGVQHLNQVPILDEAEAARQQQLFLAFQQRGRMGSIASIGTYATDNGNGTDLEDTSLGEWLAQESNSGLGVLPNGQPQGQEGPDGFDPDARRSSAPADLLHQIGIMGLNNTQIRPSPLGTHFTPDNYLPQGSGSTSTFEANQLSTNKMGLTSADLDPSPISMSSMPSSSSGGVSPTDHHLFGQSQSHGSLNFQQNASTGAHHQPVRSISLQQFPPSNLSANDSGSNNTILPHGQAHSHSNSSVSPYSDHSSAPPEYAQQMIGQPNGLFEGYQQPASAQPSGGATLNHSTSIPMSNSAHQQAGQGQGQAQGQGQRQNALSNEGKDDFSFLEGLNGETVDILV
uniref:Homeobox domain-containing protein n=1 Tax=Kwoniella dejecticola CBS 10117 TaxID=1296121 RepID=A0A1A6ACH4_9TREE|nr:uncharacterized protein I303_01967 [Kwoniella dejecticola CBS 10117]OBR87755.1 hypothetical protein I303_01967 [Kwoniella dejecticola CBS 10117]